MAVTALGALIWAFFRRRNVPGALSERRVGAARRNAAAARLALALVRELMTLPPVMRLLGLSPSYDAKRLAFSRFVMSVPTSLTTLRAV